MKKVSNLLKILAGGAGFEPALTESESVVLPLDEPPISRISLYYEKEIKIKKPAGNWILAGKFREKKRG
jgi:hypothetical protein